MGSSSGGDFGPPPTSPAPPANMISPQGQTAPFSPHFINFLGDTNVPSRGLTPEMLAAINATNGPPPGSPPQQQGGGGMDGQLNSLRNQLAAMRAQGGQQGQPPYGMRERGGGSGNAGGGGGGMGGGSRSGG